MDPNLELRKMPPGYLSGIIDILEIYDSWKKVMNLIPKNPQSDVFEHKYNNDHMITIQNYAKDTGKTCTQILFDEWSTSGRIRPTVSTLKDILVKAELFRAADHLAHLLAEPRPTRPADGPAAPIDTSITKLLNAINNSNSINQDPANGPMHYDPTTERVQSSLNRSQDYLDPDKPTAQMQSNYNEEISMNIPDLSALLNNKSHNNDMINMNVPISEDKNINDENYQTSFPNIDIPLSINIDNIILEDASLIQFDYSELEAITNSFAEIPEKTDNGIIGKIGSGGFGEVFVGYYNKYGALAIKRTGNGNVFNVKMDMAIQMFNSEVKHLSQFKHKNIVPIIGVSTDTVLCIICEYVEGGSLLDKLALKVLEEQQRLNIMLGTAEGLQYLHKSNKRNYVENGYRNPTDSQNSSSKNTYFVHGDVKSANILLTKDCVPKLCDFGLTKQCDSTFVGHFNSGTEAYLSPEARKGAVTQKNDIYSYGVVLLEVITGLKCIVDVKDGCLHIIDYIKENSVDGNIAPLLDSTVKNWTTGEQLYKLALNCLESDRYLRPDIDKICEVLNGIKKSELK